MISISRCPTIDEQDCVSEHYPKGRKTTQLQIDMRVMLYWKPRVKPLNMYHLIIQVISVREV